MAKEFAFFHYGFEDTGGSQIGGQFPLYDRGHIAEIYDSAFRSRVASSGKASIVALFDPASPGTIGGTTPGAATFTTLAASLLTVTGAGGLLAEVVGADTPYVQARDTTNGVRNILGSADTTGLIGTVTAHDLRLIRGDVEVARLTSSGLAVGKESADVTLDVGGTVRSSTAIQVLGTGSQLAYLRSANGPYLEIEDTTNGVRTYIQAEAAAAGFGTISDHDLRLIRNGSEIARIINGTIVLSNVPVSADGLPVGAMFRSGADAKFVT